MNKLHPGARWIFRLNAYSRFGVLFLILVYLNLQLIFIQSFGLDLGSTFSYGPILIIVTLLLLIILFGEIYSRMAYSRWLYEFNKEGMKIENGIIWKKYTSIPYERIQNVDIKRGVIARMFSFSTLDIETAGQSGQPSYQFRRRGYRRYKSEGHLPAVNVEEAEKIREFVMQKIKKKHSGAGLG